MACCSLSLIPREELRRLALLNIQYYKRSHLLILNKIPNKCINGIKHSFGYQDTTQPTLPRNIQAFPCLIKAIFRRIKIKALANFTSMHGNKAGTISRYSVLQPNYSIDSIHSRSSRLATSTRALSLQIPVSVYHPQLSHQSASYTTHSGEDCPVSYCTPDMSSSEP